MKQPREMDYGLPQFESLPTTFSSRWNEKNTNSFLFFFFVFFYSGGKLVGAYVAKRAKGPRCGDTGVRLNGIPALRPKQYKGVSKRTKTVSRAYGGSLSGNAVKARIVRAFLIEEQKIVKKVLQAKSKSSKKSKKESKGKKKK